MANELTPAQKDRWQRCRKIVKNGLRTYIEVGRALLEIKQSQLYLAEYATWTDYCDRELTMTRRHADRMIVSAKTITLREQPNKGQTKRDMMSQKYPRLTPAAPPARRPTGAKGTGKATEQSGPVQKEMAEATSELNSAIAAIEAAGRQARSVAESPMGIYVSTQRLDVDLKNVTRNLRGGKPFALCPYCGGGAHKCRACNGHGWINKLLHNQAPREIKE